MGERGEDQETAQLARAEAALQENNWAVARELLHQLACAVPQNKHYRAQLSYARAGALFAAGDQARAREELERTLRLVPDHAGALAMQAKIRPTGRFRALFRR
jgi:hypothetical protein